VEAPGVCRPLLPGLGALLPFAAQHNPWPLLCSVTTVPSGVPERDIRNLALIGFMGTGKSTVGHLVAVQLRFALVDTDRLIESAAGKTISDIFAQDGEPSFRAYERRVLEELGHRRDTVVATGGGLGASSANIASLKRHALVICLWAPAEVIWERVRHHGHRPLLQVSNPKERIAELLALREPIYREADVLMDTSHRHSRELAQQVIHHFLTATGKPPSE